MIHTMDNALKFEQGFKRTKPEVETGTLMRSCILELKAKDNKLMNPLKPPLNYECIQTIAEF